MQINHAMRFALGQSTEDHILNLHYSYSFLNSREWRDPLGKKKSINLKNISPVRKSLKFVS